MNPLTVSALGAAIFTAHLVIALIVLKVLAILGADTAAGQALGWLVH